MTLLKFTRRAAIAASAAMMIAGPVSAGGHQVVESIHFLIPGGAGGGWDEPREVQVKHSLVQGLLVVRPMKTCLVVVAVRPSATLSKMLIVRMAL